MADEDKNSSRSILVGTIVVAVVLMVIVVPFTIKGERGGKTDDDSVEARIQPVARVEIQKAAASAAGGKARDAVAVFNTVCAACHTTGAAGAPKTGDKAAWAPRIAQGKDTLYKSALNGKNAMPPRGGGADLSDAEVKAAVDHLIGLAK